MDASPPGRLLILQSAPVYLLFAQAAVIQLRSERHQAQIERSMSGTLPIAIGIVNVVVGCQKAPVCISYDKTRSIRVRI